MKSLATIQVIITLVIFFHCGIQVSAQSEAEIRELLREEKDTKKRVDLYNSMAWLYWNSNLELGRLYTDSALHAATENDYRKGIIDAVVNKAVAELTLENFNQSLKYLDEALDQAKQIGNQDTQNHINRLKANAFVSQGDFKKAEVMLIKVGRTVKEGSRDEASYLASLGRLYLLQGYVNKAEKLLMRSYQIRSDSGYYSHLSSSSLLLAMLRISQSHFVEAEKYLRHALRYADDQAQIFRKGSILIEYADLNIRKAKYDTAAILLHQAIDIYDQDPFDYGKMLVYHKFAELYLNSYNYVKAQEYALMTLRIAEQVNAKKYQAAIYTILAWIYKDEKNFDLGVDYVERAFEIQREIGDKRGESTTLNTLGNLYNLQGDLENALIHLEHALAIRREIGYKKGESDVLYNIGLIKEKQGDLTIAAELYSQTLVMHKELDLETGISYAYNSLASIEIKRGNFTEALPLLDKAFETGLKQKNNITLARTYHMYAQVYEHFNDFKNAYQFSKLHKNLADTLFNLEQSKQLLEMQSRYELEAKENEIALLNAGNEAQQALIAQQRTLIIAISIGLALMLFITYLVFIYSRTKSKSNKMLVRLNEEISQQKENLKEANEKVYRINQKLEGMVRERTEKLRNAYNELDTFFYKSSHDFRRPITTFMGLAEVARVTVKDENALSLFDKVKETAAGLDKMLAKLQSISYVGSQEIVYKEVFFEGIIESLLANFNDELNSKKIKFFYEVNLEYPFKSYPLYISTILENLIENAINFCIANNPEIRLSIFKEGNFLVIEIKDNGAGIPSEYQSKIFDMYFRASDRSKGNGLGLYIVKKAIDRLKGQITVESAYGIGTTFTVLLPFHE